MEKREKCYKIVFPYVILGYVQTENVLWVSKKFSRMWEKKLQINLYSKQPITFYRFERDELGIERLVKKEMWSSKILD